MSHLCQNVMSSDESLLKNVYIYMYRITLKCYEEQKREAGINFSAQKLTFQMYFLKWNILCSIICYHCLSTLVSQIIWAFDNTISNS